ncbi:hypothetical protein HDU91_000135 [Kappamyces sp. JEL0680]|nr:hypothetical protein HDU91_000135 [Kappamyces sp. JEL0680]
MTVVAPDEWIPSRIELWESAPTVDSCPVFELGVGSSTDRDVHFVVAGCPALQLLRLRLGLGWKDFHVTLGFASSDRHDVDKSPASLLYGSFDSAPKIQTGLDCVKLHFATLAATQLRSDMLQFCLKLLLKMQESPLADLGVASLLALVYLGLKRYDDARTSALDGIYRHPGHEGTVEVLIRYGDACFKLELWYEALRAFWKVYLAVCDGPSNKHGEYALKRLRQLWKLHIALLELDPHPSGLDFSAQEWDRYRHWRMTLLDTELECSAVSVAEPRIRHYVTGIPAADPSYKLPRNFSYVLPLCLAGMSTPTCQDDISTLRQLGFRQIVTLTEEEPLPESWFALGGIKNSFWPIENYYPPSFGHADALVDVLKESLFAESPSDRGAVLVHCGGGKGRAGTLLACYLARFGLAVPPPPCVLCRWNPCLYCLEPQCLYGGVPKMDAGAAIALIRTMRPGSIERPRQEEFVVAYVSELWRRIGMGARMTFADSEVEKEPIQLQVLKKSSKAPLLLVLCGLPGSGKTWFAERLQLTGKNFVCVSQDESGSRDTCLSAVSAHSKRLGAAHRLVVDRCNPTRQDRNLWRQLAGNPPSACIYFDASADRCIERISRRFNHPTVRSNSGPSVVKSFARQMEPVDVDEPFDAIYVVSTFGQACRLVEQFGGTVRDASTSDFVKYPRTRHLFDLGGATRDDLCLSDADAAAFLTVQDGIELVMQEKVDGANLGIRLDPKGNIVCQNRTHVVTSSYHPQFSRLGSWIHRHRDALVALLAPGCILFGEWLQARHSIAYDQLDDYFLAFDLFDLHEHKFYSSLRFRQALQDTGIAAVPQIPVPDKIDKQAILNTIHQPSAFSRAEQREGVVLRRDSALWMVDKAKVVRSNFIAGNKHWSSSSVVENAVSSRFQ